MCVPKLGGAWEQHSVIKDHHVDSHYFLEEVGNIEREANNKKEICATLRSTKQFLLVDESELY